MGGDLTDLREHILLCFLSIFMPPTNHQIFLFDLCLKDLLYFSAF
jgi:hypothetical protein